MMMRRFLCSVTVAFLGLDSILVAAFVPHVPLNTPPVVLKKKENKNPSSTLVAKLGRSDMKRRRRFNKIMNGIFQDDDPTHKEYVQNHILSEKMAVLLQNCNWKLRRQMLFKIRCVARAVDVPVPANFGQPPSQADREQTERQARKHRIEQKAHFFAEAKRKMKELQANRKTLKEQKEAQREEAVQRKKRNKPGEGIPDSQLGFP